MERDASSTVDEEHSVWSRLRGAGEKFRLVVDESYERKLDPNFDAMQFFDTMDDFKQQFQQAVKTASDVATHPPNDAETKDE